MYIQSTTSKQIVTSLFRFHLWHTRSNHKIELLPRYNLNHLDISFILLGYAPLNGSISTSFFVLIVIELFYNKRQMLATLLHTRKKKNNHHLSIYVYMRMSSANDFDFFLFFFFFFSMYLNRFVCVYFFQFAGEIRLKRFSLVNFKIYNCDWVMSKIENFDGLTIYKRTHKKAAC